MRLRNGFLEAVVALCAVAIALVGCSSDGGGGGSDSGGGKTTWTIVAYMAGNNNLDYSQNYNSFVIEDVQQMEVVGSTDEVNIVAVVSSLKNGGDANVYHVEYHPEEVGDNISSTLLEAWGQKDMSDPTTLKNFLELALSRYPADRYMLIIDDHGGGWRGACTDDNAGGQPMKIAEMRDAIKNASVPGWDNKFDLIVFHACLMAAVEVAYGLREVADYMVACQFVMPMESILAAEVWLDMLTKDTSIEPVDLAKSIAQAVKNRANERGNISHMAVLDLSKATAITSRIGDLGDVLPSDPNYGYWNELLDAWLNTHVTDYDDPSCVDLREFVNNILDEPHIGAEGGIIRTKAQSVLDAINEMVLFTTTNAIAIPRGGMNIYLPYLAQLWDSKYSDTAFADNNWDSFIMCFINGIESLLTGTLDVDSTPQGAAIAIDGQATGETTPAAFELSEGTYTVELTLDGYETWTQTVSVTSGETTTISATLTPEGNEDTFTIQGTIAWYDGRPLTEPVLLLAEEDDGYLYYVIGIIADPQTGAYSAQIEGPRTVWVEAWDDVNGNDSIDAGDGWNAVDNDQSGTYPTWGDAIEMVNGHTYTINITIYPVEGAKLTVTNRLRHPIGGEIPEMIQ